MEIGSRDGRDYVKITVTEEEEGRDVRWFLKTGLNLSTARIASVKFDPQGILKNGIRVTVREKVKTGDVLEILLSDSENRNRKLIPVDHPLDILYEDDQILAVNKPAGMVCHPSKGHYFDSLANYVEAYFRKKGTMSSQVHLIGRLDKDTSGVVIFSKNSVAAESLRKQHLSGKIDKNYLAIVTGIPERESGIIERRLKEMRDQETGIVRMMVSDEEDAKEARTEYRVIQKGVDTALLLVTIRTGRMHQIRCHMAAIGHPLLFDPLYGRSGEEGEHTMLHAFRLRFEHPFSKEEITVTAPYEGSDLIRYFPEGGEVVNSIEEETL